MLLWALAKVFGSRFARMRKTHTAFSVYVLTNMLQACLRTRSVCNSSDLAAIDRSLGFCFSLFSLHSQAGRLALSQVGR